MGHIIDEAGCSIEGPFLFEGRGHPSEHFFHQVSLRVERQTPHMEATCYFTSYLVNDYSFGFIFDFVMFGAVCPSCSIRDMYGVEENRNGFGNSEEIT